MKLILQNLFLFTCTVIIVLCAYFIFHFGYKYQQMDNDLIQAKKEIINLKDSLFEASKENINLNSIIKSICKPKPITQTKKYKESKYINHK